MKYDIFCSNPVVWGAAIAVNDVVSVVRTAVNFTYDLLNRLQNSPHPHAD